MFTEVMVFIDGLVVWHPASKLFNYRCTRKYFNHASLCDQCHQDAPPDPQKLETCSPEERGFRQRRCAGIVLRIIPRVGGGWLLSHTATVTHSFPTHVRSGGNTSRSYISDVLMLKRPASSQVHATLQLSKGSCGVRSGIDCMDLFPPPRFFQRCGY